MPIRLPLFLAIAVVVSFTACSDSKTSSSSNAAVSQLAAGDANCPAGGVAITVSGTTAYACNGATGQTGVKGDQGLQGAQGVPGATGLQGPTGGGYYTNRLDIQCYATSAFTSDPAVHGISASCANVNDLPLFAECRQEDTGNAVLTGGQLSAGWAANTAAPGASPATVNCMWKNGTTSTLYTNAELPSAYASICCINHP